MAMEYQSDDAAFIETLDDLLYLWPFLEEIATTRDPDAITHPTPLNHRTPVRLSVVDAQEQVTAAVTEAVSVLGISTQDQRPIASAVSRNLRALRHEVVLRLTQPGWPSLETALTVIIAPAVEQVRYLVNGPSTVARCRQCGEPVHADDDTLTCTACGTWTAPRLATTQAAALELGVSYQALRKAVARHHLTPIWPTWPPQYRFDELANLTRQTHK